MEKDLEAEVDQEPAENVAIVNLKNKLKKNN